MSVLNTQYKHSQFKVCNLWFDNYLTFYNLHRNQMFSAIADQTHTIVRKKALFFLQNINILGMRGMNHCFEVMPKYFNQVEF